MKLGLLSDVSNIISGFAFKSEWFGAGSDKIIRIGNLQNGLISDAKILTVDAKKKKISSNFRIKKNDILMALSGATTGKIAVAKDKDVGSYINQRVAIIRGKTSENKSFLRHIFNGEILKQLLENAYGAAQPNLSPKDLGKLKIPIPTIDEQKNISTILDITENTIHLRKQAIIKLHELVQSVFEDIFGNTINNNKNWPIKKIGGLVKKLGSGATPRGGSGSYKSKGISLIRSLNVHNGVFKFKNLAFIDEEQALKLSNVKVEKNDVLLNITGASVARVCTAPESILPARVNQHVMIIRPKSNLDSIFLEHLLLSSEIKKKLLSIAGSGATREAITKAKIENLEIIVPPIEVQNIFVNIFNNLKNLENNMLLCLNKTHNLSLSLKDKLFKLN
ncbi:restriction endonuclease subunit S [Candidatus Pelagibacter sp.]|nr:restriction endonuclease subunit S [Candidatus Pelagibacter sp.]